MASDLTGLIRSRIDADFDGECHLTKDEALSIIGLIDHLRDNSRIEALERENATLRAERDEARKAKEAEHQQFLQMGSKYVQKCFDLAKVREAVIEEAAQIADNYLPSTFDAKAIAAAIRNMGGRE